MTRTICVAWSGRADKGPISPVIAELEKTPDIQILRLSLPGNPDALRGYSDSAKSSALFFAKNQIDILLVLGDRYETLACCGAATVAKIPIAHIHGGEITEGAFDDAIRNAISKLSHLHFVATQEAQERLIRMGEEPMRIFLVGAPGLDNLVPILAEGPRDPCKYFVVTYHPETLGNDHGIKALVEALAEFPDYHIYWTGVNNDPGHEKITATLDYCHQVNWTPEGYLRHCRHAAAVIGNSSSFIIECPTLGVPTVNIGDRQKGRAQAKGIFNTKAESNSIKGAINAALTHSTPLFGHGTHWNPYGKPGASKKIAELLATTPIEGVLRKQAA